LIKTLNRRKELLLQIFYIIFGIVSLSVFLIDRTTNAKIFSIQFFLHMISFVCIIVWVVLLFRKIKNIKIIGQKIKFIIVSLLSVSIVTYIILCLFMYLFLGEFFKDNSLIFFQPTSISQEKAKSYIKDNVKEINITTADNVKLRGWFVQNSTNEKSPLIIYIGGSRTEVSYMIDYAKKIDGWSMVLVNNRGYGLSEGKPTEDNCINDTILVYDIFSKRKDIDNKKIVLMGWSQGANIAAITSEKRQVAGTILVAPSDSETHSFQDQYFPYIPLGFMNKRFFDAISLAPYIKTPLLCLTGEKDTSNPPHLAQNLFEKWGGEKIDKFYKNEDHHLLFHENTSWTDIKVFLKKFE
jgi:uncharacterized protein